MSARHPEEDEEQHAERQQLDEHPPELPTRLVMMTLRAMLAQKDAEISLLKKNQIPKPSRLTPEILTHREISNYFKYCTGFFLFPI